MISILIPTLNEEARIVSCLQRARESAPHAEIIVSDGGSVDGTVELAARFATVIIGEPGRGRQLNRAAASARGDVLLFLHADTLLPAVNVEEVIESLLHRSGAGGGNFAVRYAPRSLGGDVFEILSRLARPAGIFYGDSGIFVRRQAFLERGGFRQEELMEDLELARWLRSTGRLAHVRAPVVSSSRRFRGRAVLFLMLWTALHLLHFAGVPDRILARWYPPVR